MCECIQTPVLLFACFLASHCHIRRILKPLCDHLKKNTLLYSDLDAVQVHANFHKMAINYPNVIADTTYYIAYVTRAVCHGLSFFIQLIKSTDLGHGHVLTRWTVLGAD